MLNPVHLRTLREVVRHESIAVAAHQLGYTASAVSQQMSALERQCGVLLFERTGRSVRPTAAGLRLAERSIGVLLGMEALVRDVAEVATGGPGSLHLGSFPSATRHLLPGVLETWPAERPDVTLYVSDGEPSQLIQHLVGEAGLDVALVYRFDQGGYVWPRGFEVHHVGDDPLDVALPAGHPAAERGPLALADLDGEHWITHTTGVGGALAFERACAAAGFSPKVRARSDDYAAILALVRAGHGLALVPRTALRDEDGVVGCELAQPTLTREILALTRRPDEEPVERLLALIADELRDLTRLPFPGALAA